MHLAICAGKFPCQLNFRALIAVLHQLGSEFHKCQLCAGNDFAKDGADGRNDLLDHIQNMAWDGDRMINRQSKYAACFFRSEIERQRSIQRNQTVVAV